MIRCTAIRERGEGGDAGKARLTPQFCTGSPAREVVLTYRMARPSAARAASFTASVSVGWAWQVRARVFGRAAELHQHRRLGDHLAGVGADDMDAEHPIGVCVGEDLDEAVRRAVDLGAAVGGERELADLVGDPGGLQLLLGLADVATSGAV